MSELNDGDLSGAVDGRENDLGGLTDELVDLTDSVGEGTLELADQGGER